LPCKGTI